VAKELSIELISLDGGTQPRAEFMQHVIDDYAEAWASGAIFPPVIVYHDGANHWLADGYHRVLSAQKAGMETVPADVRQGSQRDAILYSVGANSDHGVRRTNADKRRAVERLLNDEEWGKWSDGEIAKRCGVTREFVNRMRPADTCDQVTSTERTFTHPKTGKPATMNTGKIGRRRSRARDFLEGAESEPLPPEGRQAIREIQDRKIALDLPRDNPEAAARTLLDFFDAAFLRRLITELEARMEGA